jgi:hypothetical protein
VRKSWALLLAVAFLLAGAAFAGATTSGATGHSAPALTNHEVSGKVMAVDTADKTFKVKGPWSDVTFVPDAAIHVTRADGAASWSDLGVGEKVSVVYHLDGKSRIATQVAIHG